MAAKFEHEYQKVEELFGNYRIPADLDVGTLRWIAEQCDPNLLGEMLRADLSRRSEWGAIDPGPGFWKAAAESAIEALTLPLLRTLAPSTIHIDEATAGP